jgi:hypothetical protein
MTVVATYINDTFASLQCLRSVSAAGGATFVQERVANKKRVLLRKSAELVQGGTLERILVDDDLPWLC